LENADGEMADDYFQKVKKLTKGRIEKLEQRLNDLAIVSSEIKDLVASALKKVVNMIEGMRTAIVGSMFPEFLVFDGTQHRTARINFGTMLMY